MRQGSHLKRSRGRPHNQGQREPNGHGAALTSDPRDTRDPRDPRSQASPHNGGHNPSQPRKHVSMRHQTFVSNGPEGIRVSGNAFTILEKYLNLARDASTGGDRIAAENYYQHAEHYFRLINANNEGQYTPQTPREHFEADSDAGGAGDAVAADHQADEQGPLNALVKAHDLMGEGDFAAPAGGPGGSGGYDPENRERPMHVAGPLASMAESNYDDGRGNNRRPRSSDHEGGGYLNHPNQTRGRGRFRERRTGHGQLYQTGSSKLPSPLAIEREMEELRSPPPYDHRSEQPIIADPVGTHYAPPLPSPQPSFDLAAAPNNAGTASHQGERMRPRRMTLSPVAERGYATDNTPKNEGDTMPTHPHNRDALE